MSQLRMETLTILLLAYNEAETIELEIIDWKEICKSLKSVKSQILIVEDGSSDGTTQILKGKMEEGAIVHLHSPARNGYKNALMRGLKEAKSDYIFMSDTGLKNDLNDFYKFWEKRKNFDLIVGHKVNRRDSRFRRFTTYAFNLYLRIIFLDMSLKDTDCGFRLLNRDFTMYLTDKGLHFKEFANSEMSLLARRKFRFLQLPISYKGRTGESRGLPPKKIPKAIAGVLKDIHIFRKTPNL
jgi:glycosyltransferase involved in cell wall biosynthesis